MSPREWLAAHDLVGLPGLPKSYSGTLRWLRDHEVTHREVPGRGGPKGVRREYRIAELPAEARAAIGARTLNGPRLAPVDAEAAKHGAVQGAKVELQADLAARAIDAVRVESLKASAALRGRPQQRLDAKLEVLRAREMFQRSSALSVKASEFHFAAKYNSGEIQVAEWIRAQVPTVSQSTLQNWRRVVRFHGITALAGNYGNRKGDGKIDRQPKLRDFVIGMLVRTPHARATHVERAISAVLNDGSIDKPTLRSIERWVAAWRVENAQTLTALANPDKWKSKYMTAFGSMSEGVLRLNQRWELDSTPGDVMLVDGRHTLLGLVDVYSRRGKLLVSKTSKATAVAALTRAGLLDFGVPEEMKTDNGADYTSKHVTRVVSALGINQILCPPFQPWHKPHVERFFGTFTRDLVELLDNFIGHSVAERQAIRDRTSFADRLMKRGEAVEITMTAADFQKFCAQWVDNIYAHRPHDGVDGKTPFEVAAAWRHPVTRIQDERALDVLLGEGEYRVVQKRGIEIDGAWFIAPELEAYVGQRVLFLQLPDLGRVVVQGGPDLQHICIAECPERTGIDRREVAIRTKAIQQARVQDERRRLRGIAAQVKTEDVVDTMLRERAAAAGKLRVLPQPAAAHDSPALAAAADAVAELNRPARDTSELMSIEDARRAREAIERAAIGAGSDNELARRRDGAQPIFENRHERVTWLLRQAHFRALTTEEQEYLALYKREQPASYRGLASMVDEQLANRKADSGQETGSL